MSTHIPSPQPYQVSILAALNLRPRNVYAGTVPDHVIAKRRAANKVARHSRRINRSR